MGVVLAKTPATEQLKAKSLISKFPVPEEELKTFSLKVTVIIELSLFIDILVI